MGADAFALAYARWYPSLVSYCRHVGCGEDSPEDVAQEAFMRAWSNWDPAAAERSIWPWLAVIAKRCCLDRWRKSARNVARAEHLRRLPRRSPPSPEECMEEAEDRAMAAWAFMQLRPGERRILGLREIERWTYQDIAEMENTSLEAVRSSLRRSRAKLREAYRRAAGAVPVAVLLGHGRRAWGHVGLAVARLRRALPLDLATFERAEVAAFSAAAAVFVAAALPGGVPAPHGATAPAQAALGRSAPTTLRVPAPMAVAGASATRHATTASTSTGTANAAHTAVGPARMPLPTDPGTTPESTAFTGFAVADHNSSIVFAFGTATGCDGTCEALFESNDGGGSWTRLQADNYGGGDILLPPSYPADSTLFDAGGLGLRASLDNGKTFVPLAPLADTAAISPAFDAGNPVILLGEENGWEYHWVNNKAGTLTPLLLDTAYSSGRTFAFAPSYPTDNRIVVGSTTGVTPSQQAVVSVCTLSSCRSQTPLPGTYVPPHVAVAPSFGRTGLAFAWNRSLLYRSTDGATTFHSIAPPPVGTIQRLTFAADDTLYAATAASGPNGRPVGGLFVSHDAGTTWTRLGQGTALANGATTVAVLGGGRLLAAPTGATGGVLCSTDDGRSWAVRCPAG